MKRKIFLLVAITSMMFANGQTTFQDAISLRKLLDSPSMVWPDNDAVKQAVADIVSRYGDRITVDSIRANPFFRPYAPWTNQSSVSSTKGLSSIISSIGKLDVTAFADGLAQFLVERTKEELNEAFFRKFRAYLDNYPEFKVLFPNTNTFTENFNSWEYANLLNTLREAFDKDIKTLLGNMTRLKDMDSTQCKDDCQKRVGTIVRFFQSNQGRLLVSGLAVGNGLLADQKIPDIIDTIGSSPYLGNITLADASQTTNLQNTVKLISIFSNSLRSPNPVSNYLSGDEFQSLLVDTNLTKLFLGLVYQQIKSKNITLVVNSASIEVVSVFKPSNITGIRNYLTNISSHAKNISIAIEKITEDRLQGKPDLGTDYAILFETSQKLIKSIASVQVINIQLQLSTTINEVFTYASNGLQIAHDIAVRNYNAAVVGLLKMLSDVSKIPAVEKDYPNLKVFNAALLKYGSFASNVCLSKDPQEVKDAIKSFALPAGSSSIKKHTSFNISLNSYVGFAYGNNKPSQSNYTTKGVSGNDSVVYLNEHNSLSVYAPVGVAFNWGICWRQKDPGSVSIYLTLLDIGSIVSYRFIEDTGNISNKFKVSLSNIFAPGANLAIGIPNVPISIGGGFQWVPTLQRDPKSNEFYNLDHSAVRFQVFAAVDLPLLNLHTSRKSLFYSGRIK